MTALWLFFLFERHRQTGVTKSVYSYYIYALCASVRPVNLNRSHYEDATQAKHCLHSNEYDPVTLLLPGVIFPQTDNQKAQQLQSAA